MKAHTIVLADAHLDGLDAKLEHFLSFLSSLHEQPVQTLYILGDLFNIWIGTPKMFLSHQKPVIDALQSLRDKGIQIKYVEGNRDYFLAPMFLDAPFHEIATEFSQERIGGKHLYFSHGDLINIHDRQYRLWRKFSRNQLIFSVFQSLPRPFAIHVVHYLEQKFRGTNRKHKSHFPQKVCQSYAEALWKQGHDAIILGHFHEEHHLKFTVGKEQKNLYILPAWLDTYKYLHINTQGVITLRQFLPSS